MTMNEFIQLISALTLLLAALVLAAIAGIIIYMMAKGKAPASIAGFIFEAGADGTGKKPSVSRLQMLIWNFVVAVAFLFVVGKNSTLEAGIEALFQTPVLVLLGISNGTYLLGKVTKQGTAKASVPDPNKPPEDNDK
jgi:hypothetical protein